MKHFNLNKTLHLFLSKLNQKSPLSGKNVVCGFSGGADSTALLYNLHLKKDIFNFNLYAVFFSHGDSPIAEDESSMYQHCKSFCESLSVPLHHEKLNLSNNGQGWESAGRNQRLNYYNNNAFDYVFLGHHLDDQVETTAIQFMRGGGKGMSSMQEFNNDFCRPFLNIPKSSIYNYLEENNISWFEDPTNTNTDFTRNFWRNDVLPLLSTHYPNYKKMILGASRNSFELNELAYDMAIQDGLNNITAGTPVNISTLSEIRLKNLIKQSFNSLKVNREDSFFDNLIKHIISKKQESFEIDDYTLNLHKGFLTLIPNQPKKTHSKPHRP